MELIIKNNKYSRLFKLSLIKTHWPLFLTMATIAIFLYKLLLGQILITPDFGRSDALHLNLALKSELARSLANWQLPIWTDKLGTGFSLIGEAQTGMFNLQNLIIFKLFPFPYSMSVATFSIVIISALGTYLFLLSLKLSSKAAAVGSILFSLSGFIIVHLQHYNLAQAASYLPWQFLFLERFIQKRQASDLFWLAFVSSQQIFAGFYQVALYAQIGIISYAFLRLWFENKQLKRKIAIAFLIATVISGSWLLSAIQTVPSWELASRSGRAGGVDFAEMFRFPFAPKDLIGFVNPFFKGNPKLGTYPHFAEGQGIFWENTGYITIIGLILAALSIFTLFGKNKLKPLIIVFLSQTVIFLAFALGQSSPTYVFFQFPPLNLFRVPSRFLMLTTLAITILAAISYEIFSQKFTAQKKMANTMLFFAIYFAITANIFWVWFNYHPTAKPANFLTAETATFIKEQKSDGRIISLFAYQPWNEIFLKHGWANRQSDYHHFLNALDPNLNLVFNIAQARTYESMLPRREMFLESFINSGIFNNGPDKAATISARAIELLKMQNVEFIISAKEINENNLKMVYQTSGNPQNSYRIYQLAPLPRFRFAENVHKVGTVAELNQLATGPNFNPPNEAIVEADTGPISQPKNAQITPLKVSAKEYRLKVETDTQALLLIADSYYPGWIAYLDKKVTPIIPANINQKAVVIPPGQHELLLKYQPSSLKIGLLISTVTNLALILFCLLGGRLKFLQRYF